jgi:hypothetical protein
MLGGFAVETLCKMVSVSHHHGKYGYPAKATKLKQIFSPTHDLSLLAANARIRINKEDREILRNLSRYVIWAGRYPAPLVSQDYNGPAIFRDSDTAGALWDAYERLYKKMYRLAVRRAFRK